MKRRSFVLSALFAPLYLGAEKGSSVFRIFDRGMFPLPAVALRPPLKMTEAIQVPDEPCPRPSLGILPPPRFVQAMSENRLIAPLRDAAKLGDPDQILTRSAVAFYIARSPALSTEKKEQLARENKLSSPALGPYIAIDEALANAIADLAVTGRSAYERFKRVQPKEETILPLVKQRLGLQATTNPVLTAPGIRPNVGMNSGRQRPPAQQPASGGFAEVNACVTSALDRAYQVAHALRGPYFKYAEARKPLGWIAVSGEDDPPHRPVNMEPLPYPQYEIPVTIRGNKLETRFYIASANAPAAPPAPTFPSSRIATRPGLQVDSSVLLPHSVPADERPFVPQGHRVILFLHGHSSSAEEAALIIPQLLAAGKARGINYSVISFDLPNNGYSTKFDHLRFPGLQSSGTTFPGGIFDNGPINTPVLDFIEEFIVAFVDQLDLITPIKNRFAGVIGGSLGGNMGLRLGRLNHPWLANGIVSWSPASVWSAMVKDETKRHAPEHCQDKWNESELPASRSNYFAEVYDGAMFDGRGGRQSFDAFLQSVFGGGHTQPDMWWSPKWACKKDSIRQSRVARYEVYHEHFRRWHWRVAGEQLIFSHIAQVRFEQGESPSNPYRYLLNRIPLLLASGEDDDYPYTGIYSATRSMAQKMVNTPGTTLFLKNTGHSIHDERPRYFAGKIVEFLS